MSRISQAFRSFFSILFGGALPADLAAELGYVPKLRQQKAPAPAAAAAGPKEGAIQILSILQRDARLVDFLMEDIDGYSDDQVGAAVRNLHDQCRQSLGRYLTLAPVIDGVEGTFTRLDAASPIVRDPSALKLLGNVPADGKVAGGVLRHKGWRAEKMDLPAIPAKQEVSIVAPAEIEVE